MSVVSTHLGVAGGTVVGTLPKSWPAGGWVVIVRTWRGWGGVYFRWNVPRDGTPHLHAWQ